MSPVKKRRTREELSPLEQALDDLTKDRGVAGNDLGRVLTDELRGYWGVPPDEHDTEILRAYATANLDNIIDSLEPKRASLATSYWKAVKSCFNLLPVVALDGVDFRETDAEDRRQWAIKNCGIADGTVRNYQDDAYEKIATKLGSGTYVPVSPSDFEKHGVDTLAADAVRRKLTKPSDVTLPPASGNPPGEGKSNGTTHASTGVVGAKFTEGLRINVAADRVDKPSVENHHFAGWLRRNWIWSVPSAATLVVLVILGAIWVPRLYSSASPRTTGQSSTAPAISIATQIPSPTPGINGAWIFPGIRPASDATELTKLGPTTIASWAPGLQGTLAGSGTFGLTITGDVASGVTITDITIQIKRRLPAMVGTLVDVGSEGENSTQEIDFNLDSSNPYATAPYDSGGKPYFPSHNITLAKNESTTLDVKASGVQFDYQFDLKLDVVVDGQVENVVALGPHGKPFEVSGFSSSNGAVFQPLFQSPQAQSALNGSANPEGFVNVDPSQFCALDRAGDDLVCPKI